MIIIYLHDSKLKSIIADLTSYSSIVISWLCRTIFYITRFSTLWDCYKI